MLPNGWIACKIKDIQTVEVQNGFSPMCVEYATRRKSLSLGALTGNSLDLTQEKFISEDCEMPSHSLLRKDDILVSRSNTKDKVGRAAVVTDEISNYYYPDLIMRFQVDAQKADCRYVAMCLQSPAGRNYFMSHAAGTSTSMVKINKSVLESFPLCLPPPEEQKKIAETLSTWDSAIEKMEKLIECKEKQRREIAFKLIFFKQNLWENHLLSDFLTPGNKTPVKDTSRYKKITVKLHKKGLEFNQQTREMADTRPFYIRNEGELIVGKQNFFNGSIAIVDKLHAGGICSNAIMSFEVNGINRFFLFEYLSDESYLRKHSMLANGTGQKELSEKDFLNFEVNVPSSNEQNEIAEILEVTEKELSLLNQQLALYKKQKQGLMQKLLTGEWRI